MEEREFLSQFGRVFGETFPQWNTPETGKAFFALTRILLAANEQMNLTAVTEPGEMLVKHYADCAFLARMLPSGASVLDVGAGAGFPTLPLAILRPDLTVTALDSTAKRMDFVQKTAEKLGVGVSVCVKRAEDAGKDPALRERFDCVTARAVARLNVLCELCLPLCRVGGTFFALKGAEGQTEAMEAELAASTLGGDVREISSFLLPDPEELLPPDARRRTVIRVEKISSTPDGYPRRFARIRSDPL